MKEKACPLCDNKVKIWKEEYTGYWSTHCQNCGCGIRSHYQNKEDLIREWNMRVNIVNIEIQED